MHRGDRAEGPRTRNASSRWAAAARGRCHQAAVVVNEGGRAHPPALSCGGRGEGERPDRTPLCRGLRQRWGRGLRMRSDLAGTAAERRERMKGKLPCSSTSLLFIYFNLRWEKNHRVFFATKHLPLCLKPWKFRQSGCQRSGEMAVNN